MSSIVHVRRTIVVEYDIDREDYGTFTDDEIVAAETLPIGRPGAWSIVDYEDGCVTDSSAEVTFR